MNDLQNHDWRTFWRDGDEGSSAVEFALILPLMLTLLFGLLEVGRLFYSYNIASAAVRDAGRFAARLPMTCAAGLTEANDPDRVRNLARTGTADGSAAPLLAGWTANDNSMVEINVSCVDNTPTGSPPVYPFSGRFDQILAIPVVEVVGKPPYDPLLSGLFPGLQVGSLRVSHQQVWIN